MDPVPIFTIDTSSIVTVKLFHTIITIQLILRYKTGELDNLTVCWGKVLCLCCAGFHVACNTFETFPSIYWFDNLGFLLREDLLLCFFTPCSWGFPTKCSTSTRNHQQLLA